LRNPTTISRSPNAVSRRPNAVFRRLRAVSRRLNAEDSLSWKVTRPLRGVEKKLSRITLPTRLSSFFKRSMRV